MQILHIHMQFSRERGACFNKFLKDLRIISLPFFLAGTSV